MTTSNLFSPPNAAQQPPPSTATNSHDQVSETNNFTHPTPDPQEIHSIVNEMRSTAAIGLHELNAGFYKSI